MNITNTYDETLFKELKDQIRNFNNINSPLHKLSRQEGYIKHIIMTEQAGDVLKAGLTARHYWDMIYLDVLFVYPDYRGQGHALKMMTELIRIAKEKAVNFIVLETYSFQARVFYEKFDFEVVGEIKDYPPGESFYTMRLDIKK